MIPLPGSERRRSSPGHRPHYAYRVCERAPLLKLSGDTLLDVAGARAVLLWQCTPTTVGDQPVPVVMRVTVTFRVD